MRRFISLLLVFCLLHTSTYAAVADLAALSLSPPTHNSQAVTFPDNNQGLPLAPPLLVDPDTATIEMPPAPVKAPKVPSNQRAKHSLAYLGTVATLTVLLSLGAGAGTWWSLQPPKVAPTDVCMPHKTRDDVAHSQQRQYHASSGDLPLEEGIQDWLNENAKVMEVLGNIAHNWQHGDREEARKAWAETKPQVYNVLHNHGVEGLGGTSIGCDIHLGDGTTPDTVVECRREQPPRSIKSETFKEGVDARIWFHPTRHHHLLREQRIQMVVNPFLKSHLYQEPEQSLDIESKEARHDSWRRLLQAGNTLTLPEAIQATLNERNDVKQLLARVAENLRQWNPATEEIKALNALIKGIFEAHGYIMTGDVQCGFVLENGDLKLSGCTLTSTRRAARSFAAEEASEKVTFRQSLQNPVKFDAVDVETDVLSPEVALPLVLHRAAAPLHGELDQLRQAHCSPEDRSRTNDVANTVRDALEIPNVVMSEDMACDVTVRDGTVHTVACHPAEAPESAVCGTYNGTFAANGRVWIKPNGALVISANRDWNTTATAELPHTLTPKLPETPTVSHPRSVTLPHTVTPKQTASESLPVVERPRAPANTTTRLYWSNLDNNEIWVAEVDSYNLLPVNPRIFLNEIIQPFEILVDEKHQKLYWATTSEKNIMVANLNNLTGLPYISNSRIFVPIPSYGIYLDKDEKIFYFQPSSATGVMQLSYFKIDPSNPIFDPNFNNYSYPGSSGAYGLVVHGKSLSVYGHCKREICISKINISSSTIQDDYKLTNMSLSHFPESTYPVGIALDETYNLLFWRDRWQTVYVAKYQPGTTSETLTPIAFLNTSLNGVYGGISLVHGP